MLDPAELSSAARATLARSNVRIIGRGSRPMVFTHGFGADQTMWRLVARHFEADWRIVLHDLVGSGDSQRSEYRRSRYEALDGYADDLREICDALQIENAVHVGHSIAAMIGVKLANREPRCIERLIMLGPSPRFLNDTDYVGGLEQKDVEEFLYLLESNHAVWSAQMAPLVMANADRPELAQQLANSFHNMDRAIARHFARVTFYSDCRADVMACTKPALVVQCTHDPLVPLAVGDYLSRVMRKATLRLLEGSGHFPHVSAPEQTAKVMLDYLRAEAPERQ